jgi:hypothetical protein
MSRFSEVERHYTHLGSTLKMKSERVVLLGVFYCIVFTNMHFYVKLVCLLIIVFITTFYIEINLKLSKSKVRFQFNPEISI